MDVDSPAETRITPQQILARNKSKVSDLSTKTTFTTAPKTSSKTSLAGGTTRKRASKSEAPVTPSAIPRPVSRTASSRSPRVQEALTRNGYRLDNILDKLLAQKELPGNLTLGEIMVLIDPPRASRLSTGTIDRRMQKESIADISTLEFEEPELTTGEDIIVCQKPLHGTPYTLPNLYATDVCVTANYERRLEEIKREGPKLKYKHWEERIATHSSIPRNLLAVKFRTQQRRWRLQLFAQQEALINNSVLWLVVSAIPVFGPTLMVLLGTMMLLGKCIFGNLPTKHTRAQEPLYAEVALLGTTPETGNSYFSPAPKVVVTMPGRTKVTDVRATLDTGAEVSCMTLEAATLLELPITGSQTMALKTITGVKSRFVGFADNVTVAIGNCVVNNRFYIMDAPGMKVILGFPFFRKARVSFRYPRDYDGGIVLAQFWDQRSRDVTTVKTNDATEDAKDAEALREENGIGMIFSEQTDSEDGYEEEDFSGKE